MAENQVSKIYYSIINNHNISTLSWISCYKRYITYPWYRSGKPTAPIRQTHCFMPDPIQLWLPDLDQLK